MAEQIYIRVTKETPSTETIEKAAENLGMNKNQLITEGIKMMCTWDKVFYSKMKRYADNIGITMAQVMQNFLIKRLADDAAKTIVYGGHRGILPEFMMTDQGLITGEELFNTLRDMQVEELNRQRARDIRYLLLNGHPESLLSEEDKEVLRKYGG